MIIKITRTTQEKLLPQTRSRSNLLAVDESNFRLIGDERKEKPIRSYKKRTKRFTGQFQLRGVDLEKPSSDHDGTRESPLFFFFLTSKEWRDFKRWKKSRRTVTDRYDFFSTTNNSEFSWVYSESSGRGDGSDRTAADPRKCLVDPLQLTPYLQSFN